MVCFYQVCLQVPQPVVDLSHFRRLGRQSCRSGCSVCSGSCKLARQALDARLLQGRVPTACSGFSLRRFHLQGKLHHAANVFLSIQTRSSLSIRVGCSCSGVRCGGVNCNFQRALRCRRSAAIIGCARAPLAVAARCRRRTAGRKRSAAIAIMTSGSTSACRALMRPQLAECDPARGSGADAGIEGS